MSFVSAIDAFTEENNRKKLGENGHCEYGWSSADIQEHIVQFFFQLVRSDGKKIVDLQTQFHEILKSISEIGENQSKYVSIVLRLMCHTRDIVSGKGEYALSYMMLFVLYQFFPQQALNVVETFVILGSDTQPSGSDTQPYGSDTQPSGSDTQPSGSDTQPSGSDTQPSGSDTQPYGSWKDMKYIAHYAQLNGNENHEIVQKCVDLIRDQLIKDIACETDAKISLCAKWVPRETSKKHAWFFKRLAKDFFKDAYFMKSAILSCSQIKAQNKCYMKYRQLITDLNRKLDTVQIKQCGGTWKDIDHNKTTSITLSRNKHAFLNINKKREQRSILPDRITCAEKFKTYIDGRVKSGKDIKGKNVGLNHFTRQAIELIQTRQTNSVEAALLNSQWRSNSTINGALGKMIAMVDVSSSMSGEPMEVAIALGLRVAEKSILGKRVLTFSEAPTWHNLDGKDDFVSMVHHLTRAQWGMNTNFYAALSLILDAMIEKKVPPEEVEGMVLAIFSDMQIDEADRTGSRKTMMDNIVLKYNAAGYTCPHILFWNLRSTSGFPCKSNEKGASIMSGFSPALLNMFCDRGLEALNDATPWNMMLEMLNDDRYDAHDREKILY